MEPAGPRLLEIETKKHIISRIIIDQFREKIMERYHKLFQIGFLIILLLSFPLQFALEAAFIGSVCWFWTPKFGWILDETLHSIGYSNIRKVSTNFGTNGRYKHDSNAALNSILFFTMLKDGSRSIHFPTI